MKSATARHLLVDSEELCLDLKKRISSGEKFDLVQMVET
jgi:peptidyl-prolyl cis-trans isomerase C